MSQRDASRSPRGLGGDPSATGDDSHQGSPGTDADLWRAVRGVQRDNPPHANDIVRMDSKLDQFLRNLNDYNDRVRTLERQVEVQSQMLAQQRKELDEWQRWWTMYGESMCWYFYYRY